MVLSLLFLSAAALGYAGYRSTLLLLEGVDGLDRDLRLKRWLSLGRTGTFLDLTAWLGERAQRALQGAAGLRARSFLERTLLRMNRPHWLPAHLLGFQVLFSSLGFLLTLLSTGSLLTALFGWSTGLFLPLLWARDQALKREGALLRDLPDSIEVISLCSEAGLTLEQGIEQYWRFAGPGPLREEWGLFLEQVRSGSSRKEALESAAVRLDLPDFTLFTSSLVQSDRTGTGLSQTLRQLSLTLRDKQNQRFEKTIQQMPVRLLVPLIFFIMPVTFIILFGPILLQFLGP